MISYDFMTFLQCCCFSDDYRKILRLSIFLPINGLKTEDSIFKSVGQARFCSS
jgi:hypothetical protein